LFNINLIIKNNHSRKKTEIDLVLNNNKNPRPFLVFRFVRFARPIFKNRQAFVAQKVDAFDVAFFNWAFDFVVNKMVVETDVRRVFVRAGVKYLLRSRPVNRAQTHRTRFARSVNNAIVELKRVQLLAGVSDGDNFGVRRRVVNRSYLIKTFADDFIVFDDDRAERSARARVNAPLREADGAAHKFFVSFGHLFCF